MRKDTSAFGAKNKFESQNFQTDIRWLAKHSILWLMGPRLDILKNIVADGGTYDIYIGNLNFCVIINIFVETTNKGCIIKEVTRDRIS